MKPKKSRSTVGRGMNLGTRYHKHAKAYSRKGKFGKVME